MSSQLEQDRQVANSQQHQIRLAISEQQAKDEQAREVASLITTLNNSLASSLTNVAHDSYTVKTRAAIRVHPAQVSKGVPSQKLSVSFNMTLTSEQKELMFTIARLLEKSPQDFMVQHFGFTSYDTPITQDERKVATKTLREQQKKRPSQQPEVKRVADKIRYNQKQAKKNKNKRYDMPPPLDKEAIDAINKMNGHNKQDIKEDTLQQLKDKIKLQMQGK